MRIKITKYIADLPQSQRPVKGKVYDVIDVLQARYNPTVNCMYRITVQGHTVMVHAGESEVV